MANCIIYKDGEQINSIVADEDFAAKYCSANGYTYEMVPDPEPVKPEYTEAQLLGQQYTDLELAMLNNISAK